MNPEMAEFSVYNAIMNRLISDSLAKHSQTGEELFVALKRVAAKVELIATTVKCLQEDHVLLQEKIDDAQQRIQHILSRLPEQSDGRQMNLLGEVLTPSTPEDSNEPTTH